MRVCLHYSKTVPAFVAALKAPKRLDFAGLKLMWSLRSSAYVAIFTGKI
jgi:hypothetical protein